MSLKASSGILYSSLTEEKWTATKDSIIIINSSDTLNKYGVTARSAVLIWQPGSPAAPVSEEKRWWIPAVYHRLSEPVGRPGVSERL